MVGSLDDAVALHRAGRLREAASAYEAVLAQRPHEVDAWQLLGLVRHKLGEPTEALAALDRAVALDGGHAAAWANRGLVLRALQQPDGAAESFRRATELRPGFREPLLNLARLEAQRGRLHEARAAGEAAVRHHPDDPESLRLVGLLRAQTGALDEAVAAWAQALRSAPDAGLAMALGQALLQLGRPDDAIAPLAFAMGGAPAHALFADAVLQARTFPSGLDDALGRALGSDRVDHQRLERALHHLLAPLDDDALLAHPLFVPWLTRCLVQHPHDLVRLEHLFASLVRTKAQGRPVPLDAACALATQAWMTEHAWAVDDDVRHTLAVLPDGQVTRALRAVIQPWSPDTPRPPEGPLCALWDATVGVTIEESALADGIDLVGLGHDSVSADVRAMYEDNPYPRRVGVHRPPPVPLGGTLAMVGLKVPSHRPLRVLVAGAGTGQHPLQTATRYADVDVLGIDLSRASLARATRVARRHGIDNVRFAQGDLLELDRLDASFDVVESVGVLHHLAEPLDGWRALCRRLAPDGVMRIGLYAERGRADVVAARQLVADWGLGDDPDSLREARRRFLALAHDHPAKPVVRSPDFPSLSGLRDLVFHVCEHRYTLPRLSHELDQLGLRFAGFQHTLPEAALRYRERWPDDLAQADLARWDALEAEHPRLFAGMYVFWCAARGPQGAGRQTSPSEVTSSGVSTTRSSVKK